MAKKKDIEQTPQPQEENWQARAEEYRTIAQRTQADFVNYRKRMDEARTELGKLATAEAYVKFTPILDDFHRAFAHLPASDEASPWVVGIRQVEKNVRSLLAAAGLTPIEHSDTFNPSVHEAIAYEVHPTKPEGALIDIVEYGWRLGDRVIKPARVRVSKGPTQ